VETFIATILSPLHYIGFACGYLFRPFRLGLADGFSYWDTRCLALARKEVQEDMGLEDEDIDDITELEEEEFLY